MHFLDLSRKMLLLAIALLGLSLLGMVNAFPVEAPEVDAPTVETLEATQLVSRGQGGGWATYYDAQGGRGACGKYARNKDHVVAIGKPLWDSTQGRSGTSSLCGKTATVKWRGKSVRVRVVDECPVCGYNDVDLSPSAFQKLASKEVGKLNGIVLKFDQ